MTTLEEDLILEVDLGGDAGAGGEADGDEAAGGDEPESSLLAAPGNRSSDERDKNGKVSRGDGKGRRKIKAVKNSESGRAARANSTKSVVDPMKRMFKDPVANIVNTVYEVDKKEIYDKEEKQLFNISHDIKILLESMEPKEK